MAGRRSGGEGPAARRRRAALAGHRGDKAEARTRLADVDPVVRATAIGALARLDGLRPEDVADALRDPDPAVRRRACEAASAPGVAVDLLPSLADVEATVVEMAAWAAGERGDAAAPMVGALVEVAADHDDALCREAAVAALGALGDVAGLPAILAATGDKPAVRRRAVIALAAFDGPEVDAALNRARTDRDWQTRQAAEDLLS